MTWYKITYTGEQVAQWDFQNKATRASSPGPAFVLEVLLRNLLTSICNFGPCDGIMQRPHMAAAMVCEDREEEEQGAIRKVNMLPYLWY